MKKSDQHLERTVPTPVQNSVRALQGDIFGSWIWTPPQEKNEAVDKEEPKQENGLLLFSEDELS